MVSRCEERGGLPMIDFEVWLLVIEENSIDWLQNMTVNAPVKTHFGEDRGCSVTV